MDDYQQKIKNQPEVPLQTRQQMISHLLDLEDMILRVQETIFSFHGRDLHESKVNLQFHMLPTISYLLICFTII